MKHTLYGIKESHQLYLDWSGNEWLWNAPEYLITIKIAENIARIRKNKYVTLEDNVDYILREAKAKGQGKVAYSTRVNGRFDIVLWFANGKPRAIIEVKHRVFQYQNIIEDILRITSVLNRKKASSSLKFGIMAFYMSSHYVSDAKTKLVKQIDNIFEQAKNHIGNLTIIKQNEIFCDDKNIYAAVVFLIKK